MPSTFGPLLRAALAGWLLVVGSGLDTLARAQSEGSATLEESRERARALGRRGLEAYDRQAFAEAIEAFRQSLSLFDFPTLRLYLARSLERTGRVVEATQTYRALLASPVAPDEGSIGADARRAAQLEVGAVAARRATLTLVARSEPLDAIVEVNGERWADDRIGQPQFVDPGDYAIRVTRADRLLDGRHVTLEAGSSHSIPLLAPTAGPSAPAPTSAASAPGSSGSWDLPLTVSVLATAALVVGTVVTGVLSLDRQSDFDALNHQETPFERRDAAHARARRMQLLNALCLGGAVLGAGTTVLILIDDGPDPAPVEARRVSSASKIAQTLHIGFVGHF
jgi:hypothetical protein